MRVDSSCSGSLKLFWMNLDTQPWYKILKQPSIGPHPSCSTLLLHGPQESRDHFATFPTFGSSQIRDSSSACRTSCSRRLVWPPAHFPGGHFRLGVIPLPVCLSDMCISLLAHRLDVSDGPLTQHAWLASQQFRRLSQQRGDCSAAC